MKIKDISTVQTGVYLKETSGGEARYLQVKSFDYRKVSLISILPSLVLNDKVKKHLLSEGDLLFAAKGFVNFCVVFREEWGISVASSSFLILKIHDKTKVMPEYVCWFLNRSDVLAFFQNLTAGSVLPSISKTMLENFEIDVPDISLQGKIVAVSELQQQEQILSEKIMELKNKLIEKQLVKKIESKTIWMQK
ncbi:MAG: restriction endonuclease subunit S [Dysgonamonadaceae bacterium]|nr:restriction endonuclease subunit S [Dysgonamonadaceae bacterium]